MPHVDMKDAKQVLALIKDEGIELVDIRFCDLPGLMQHFTMTSEGLDEDSFVEGCLLYTSPSPRD